MPWLFVLGWGLIAALGEPAVFHPFDIWLRHQAVFAGALGVLVAQLLSSPLPRSFLARVVSHAMVAGCATIAVGIVLVLTGLVISRQSPNSASARAALQFALAALPLAVAAAAARNAEGIPQTVVRQILTAICAAATVAIAVQPWNEPLGWKPWLAVGACTLASIVLMACSDAFAMMRIDHEDRNSR